MIVEAMHVVGMRLGQFLAVVLLDLGFELIEAQVVDQIFEPSDFRSDRLPKSRCTRITDLATSIT